MRGCGLLCGVGGISFFCGLRRGWIEGGRETEMRRGRRWEWGERRISVSLVVSFREYVFIYGGALLLYRLVEKVFYPVCL